MLVSWSPGLLVSWYTSSVLAARLGRSAPPAGVLVGAAGGSRPVAALLICSTKPNSQLPVAGV